MEVFNDAFKLSSRDEKYIFPPKVGGIRKYEDLIVGLRIKEFFMDLSDYKGASLHVAFPNVKAGLLHKEGFGYFFVPKIGENTEIKFTYDKMVNADIKSKFSVHGVDGNVFLTVGPRVRHVATDLSFRISDFDVLSQLNLVDMNTFSITAQNARFGFGLSGIKSQLGLAFRVAHPFGYAGLRTKICRRGFAKGLTIGASVNLHKFQGALAYKVLADKIKISFNYKAKIADISGFMSIDSTNACNFGLFGSTRVKYHERDAFETTTGLIFEKSNLALSCKCAARPTENTEAHVSFSIK